MSHGLEYKAYQATNAVCDGGYLEHFKGTEAESSSLWLSSAPCDSDQEKSEIEALKTWYSECPDYYGQGFTQSTGHFTQMVWKSCKTYGIWAQTCDRPGTSIHKQCVVALKMDCSANLQGSFSSQVQPGNCANVET